MGEMELSKVNKGTAGSDEPSYPPKVVAELEAIAEEGFNYWR